MKLQAERERVEKLKKKISSDIETHEERRQRQLNKVQQKASAEMEKVVQVKKRKEGNKENMGNNQEV